MRNEPGAAGWEVQMLPLGYAAPKCSMLLPLIFFQRKPTPPIKFIVCTLIKIIGWREKLSSDPFARKEYYEQAEASVSLEPRRFQLS